MNRGQLSRGEFIRGGLLVLGGLVSLEITGCAELGVMSTWMPDVIEPYWDLFRKNAYLYKNVSPHLTASMSIVESGVYTQADSGQALGIMQITIPTAILVAGILKLNNFDPYVDLLKPEINITIGTKYISMLIDENGSTDMGVCRYYGQCEKFPDGYKDDIMGMYNERNSSSSPSFDRWFLKHNGGDLSKAFTEQGKDYNAWYQKHFYSKTESSTADNSPRCTTYTPDTLPRLIHPGDTVGSITVQSGDSASKLWQQQGSPSEIEICKQ